MKGVRPRPPPTITSKPTSPAAFLCMRRPMSCTRTAARSFGEPVTAILNLRGRKLNSGWKVDHRSEEHTSELQSLMRISYAVFCLKKKTNTHLDNQVQLR